MAVCQELKILKKWGGGTGGSGLQQAGVVEQSDGKDHQSWSVGGEGRMVEDGNKELAGASRPSSPTGKMTLKDGSLWESCRGARSSCKSQLSTGQKSKKNIQRKSGWPANFADHRTCIQNTQWKVSRGKGTEIGPTGRCTEPCEDEHLVNRFKKENQINQIF